MTEVSQWREHLDLANETRATLKGWRDQVAEETSRAGALTLAELLENGPVTGAVGALRLEHALTSIRRVGRRRAVVVMRRARVMRHGVRLRDLSDRERRELAYALRWWFP